MDAQNDNQRRGGGTRSTAAASPRRLRRAAPPPMVDVIPAELRALQRWVVWDYIDYGDGKKPRKVPVAAGSDAGLKWNTSSNWRSFDEVIEEARARGGLGIGFVFDEGDGFNGVDLDDAFTAEGALKPWALDVVERFSHTYAERTPSGRGLHILGTGDRISGKTMCRIVEAADAIERYSQDRWFTFTGAVFSDRPVDDIRAAMGWLAETWFPDSPPQSKTTTDSVDRPADPPLDAEIVRVCLSRLRRERAFDADDWRRVGYALKGAGIDLSAEWHQFSKQWPDYSEAECQDRWNRFRPAKAGVQTLIGMASDDSGLTFRQIIEEAERRLGRAPAIRSTDVIATACGGSSVAMQAVGDVGDECWPHSGGADLSRSNTLTDVGLARRLAKTVRGRLAFMRERKDWVAWDGRRWAENGERFVFQAAKRVHDEVWSEFNDLPTEVRTMALFKFAKASGSRSKITAMVKLAEDEPGINAAVDEFDAHPWLLNVANGVIDLRTGELRAHDPKLKITQLAAVEFQPGARSELWERFIREVTQEDEELARFLQQSFGLALCGDVSDEVLWCHNGEGCNGKSTALEALAAMLGDYAATAPPGLFAARSFDSHPTEVAGLRGKRFVTAIEQEANRALRESLVKTLTGGDTIRTRGMRENFWQMRPTWHIHIAYNRAPRLTGTDDGIRRRLRVVPWLASFKGSPDLSMKARLCSEAERPGILNWCLDGLRDRIAQGRLTSPDCVMLATDDYIDDEDLIGRFLIERTESADHSSCVELRTLMRAFQSWLEAEGSPRYVRDTFTANSVGRELARRGYRKMRPDSGPYRKQTVIYGVRLIDTLDDLAISAEQDRWSRFA